MTHAYFGGHCTQFDMASGCQKNVEPSVCELQGEFASNSIRRASHNCIPDPISLQI